MHVASQQRVSCTSWSILSNLCSGMCIVDVVLQWQDGVFCGHGVESFADGALYVGCYADGMAHGHGVCLYQDGSIYEGQV